MDNKLYNYNKINNLEFVGRDNELSILKQRFDDVCEDNMRVTSIIGPAGSGKTFLVEKCSPYFVSNEAAYIKAKFEREAKDDFSTIVEIVDEIFKRVLTLEANAYKMVTSELNKKLSADIEILVSLSPYASKVLNQKKIKSNDVSVVDSKRLIDTLIALIKIASRIFFPLVLFIDDIQWAEKNSIDFIKNLSHLRGLNMYIILAFRDNADKINDLKRLTDDIVFMNNLSHQEVKDLVTVRLGDRAPNIENIVTFIHTLSSGNAFYVNHMIDEISNGEDESYFDKTKVDMDSFKNINLFEHMQDTFFNQIMKLEKTELEFLQTLSLYGGRADILLMQNSTSYDKQKIKTVLKSLELFISIEDLQTYESSLIHFTHDIIHELVFKTQDKKTKSEMCLSILDRLFHNTDKEYLLSKHYDITKIILLCEKSKVKKNETLVRMLLSSAIEARTRQAFEYAFKILGFCEYLADEQKSELKLDIELEYMHLEFICEKEDQSRKRYNILCDIYSKKQDLIRIKLRYLYYYSYSANYDMVISQGKEILKLLNFNFNKKNMPVDLLQSHILFTNNKIDYISDSKQIKDQRILTIFEVLAAMFIPANRTDLGLFAYINIKIANISIKHGLSIYSAIGYSNYSFILLFILKNAKKSKRLQQATLNLLSDENISTQKSIAYTVLGISSYHWLNDSKKTLDILNSAVEYAQLENEYLFSNYAMIIHIKTKYASGYSLDEVALELEKNKKQKPRLENYITRQDYKIFTSHIHHLKFGEETFELKQEQYEKALYDTLDINAKMLKVHTLYLEQKYKECTCLVKENKEGLKKMTGYFLKGDVDFYYTLSLISHNANLIKSEKTESVRIIKKQLKNLKKWSDVGASIHKARYKIAKTLFENIILGENVDVGYFEAIDLSKQEENIQLEALSNLMLARYYKDKNKKTCEFFAGEAVNLYQTWGAYYICKIMRSEFGLEDNIAQFDDLKNKRPPIKQVQSHLSIVDKFSSDQAFEYCLEYMQKTYGIDKSYIIFEENLKFIACYKGNQKQTKLREPINIKYIDDISAGLIRYVSRYEKTMFINKTQGNEHLQSEKLDLETKNYCAIPFKNKDILIGVLYFEVSKRAYFNDDILKDITSLIYHIASKIEPKESLDINTQNLTKREIEILLLIGKGLSNTDISKKLHISYGTTKNHLSNIYNKLGVKSRLQAAMAAKELLY